MNYRNKSISFIHYPVFLLKKLCSFIKKGLSSNESLTLLIVPHAPSKKVKSLKFSPLIITALIFLNMVLLSAVCIFAKSYRSLNESLADSKERYEQLELKNKYDENKISEYEALNKQIQKRIEKLEDLETELNKIIDSKSSSPQSANSSSELTLASRGMSSINASKYYSKSYAGSDDYLNPQHITLALDSLIIDINKSIDDYNSAEAAEEKRKKELLAIPSLLPAEGTISSGFGYRKDPFGGGYALHKGLDIANSKGTPIKAAGSGVVTAAGRDKGGYGIMIKINHKNGYQTVYGHNSKLAVKVGDEVKKGQVIAYMGSTGRSTGTHCHFEIWLNGKCINPLSLIK